MNRAARLIAVLLVAVHARPVLAADYYPVRPIRCLVNSSPGGAPDIFARTVGQKITENTGQQFVVDARPGGGGVIAGELAAKAPADGYTLIVAGAALFGALPATRKRLPFDPFKDFAPITLIADSPNIVVVNPSLPAKSIAELIDIAKTKPLLYASTGTITPSHLAAELFNVLAGVRLTHVPYKGAGPALADLIAGQVQLLITAPISAGPHITSGRVRALAVTGRQRSSAFPDLPTVAETVSGYEMTQWWGLLAPAGTPERVRQILFNEAVRALRAPEVRERFAAQAATPGGGSPRALADHMQAELARTRKIVALAGIAVEN